SKKPFSFSTANSSRICRFPVGITFRFLVRRIAATTKIAIITHVTTTDSGTGIPPKIGIVKTVATFSFAISSSDKLPILLHLFYVHYFQIFLLCPSLTFLIISAFLLYFIFTVLFYYWNCCLRIKNMLLLIKYLY